MTDTDTHPTITDPGDPVIQRLAALQQQLAESDGRFSARWLGVSGTTWLRLKAGTYGAKDQSAVLEKLKAGLASLQEHLLTKSLQGGKTLLDFASTQAVRAGIREADASDRNRLVIYLAPTGGGKTKLSMQLAEQYPNRVVLCEASEPWRESYLAALLALCEAVGLRNTQASTRVAEATLLAELHARPRVLVIDEAHYFGARTLNLVKLLLNRTESVVVLLAIPLLWDRVQRASGTEVEQLRTRTAAHVRVDKLTLSDLASFLANRLPTSASLGRDSACAIQLVQEACNRFGLWDTAERICTQVRADAGSDGEINLERVKSAIRTVETLRK